MGTKNDPITRNPDCRYTPSLCVRPAPTACEHKVSSADESPNPIDMDVKLVNMVDSVAASTYCLVNGESMWPTRMTQVKPGKYSNREVTTTGYTKRSSLPTSSYASGSAST